ncbi:efflux RND transporter periplasmic adaptor subunit [Desulfomarina sp.]
METGKMLSLPRLRNGLRFTPIIEKGTSWYILEDPMRNSYYRIGVEEYLFLSNLNDAPDFETLLQEVAENCGTDLTREQGEAILHWLTGRQLLQDDSGHLALSLEREQLAARLKKISRLNLISFKISLFNPDLFLDRVYPKLLWLTGRLFFFFWVALAVFGLGILVARWGEFAGQVTGFFSPAKLLLIWLIWFLLKLLHELFHALVCRRYGGRVYDFGLLFILFIPLTYIDATSSWSFPSKWQRMHVAVAGIFAELCIAWFALFVWGMIPMTTAGLIAHNTVMVAGISSLLFNANPLMRFDGYYVLSDVLSIPNLYGRGMAFIKSFAGRVFLGVRGEGLKEKGISGFFIQLYGVSVYVWKILIIISLGYIASRMAGGFGVFIALGAVIIWVGLPLVSFFSRLQEYKKHDPAIFYRFFVRFLVVAGFLGLGIRYIGWQDQIRIPAVVEYRHKYDIRTTVDGFVDEIKVNAGEQVDKGRLLAVLENRELRFRYESLQLKRKKLELEVLRARSRERLNEIQVLEEQMSVLDRELGERKKDLVALHIHAPGAGTVAGLESGSLLGTYITRGREIIRVVSKKQKYMVASCSQNDIDRIRALVGKEVSVDMRKSGSGEFAAVLTKVSPTAATDLVHPAMGAVFGGPLDVRRRVVGNGVKNQYYRYELFGPRFKLEIALPEVLKDRLRVGQSAVIRIRGSRVILWERIVSRFENWLRSKQGK